MTPIEKIDYLLEKVREGKIEEGPCKELMVDVYFAARDC